MNILVLDEWLPYPPDTGKKIRTYNLLSRLARRHDITFLCFLSPETEQHLTGMADNIQTVLVPDRRTSKHSFPYYSRVLLNLFQQYPFSAKYSYLPAMEVALGELVAKKDFDVLICEWTPYAHYFADLDHPCKILMAHNVECQQWMRMHNITRNPFKKILFKKQWRNMYRYERNSFDTFQSVVVVSAEDQSLVQQMSGHQEIFVAENGVDTDYFQPISAPPKNNVVYSASMDAFTNQNAALYFAEDIFPLIRRKDPTLEFYIVGRNPNKQIRSLANRDGIVVTGTVDDVRPYLGNCAVAVVPLRAGGGTRLKILEAMSMGVPVVSTSIGAEGLRVEHEQHLLLADTEQDFADAVLRCRDDQKLREKLITNAMDLVHQWYSWDYIGGKLCDYLDELAARCPRK